MDLFFLDRKGNNIGKKKYEDEVIPVSKINIELFEKDSYKDNLHSVVVDGVVYYRILDLFGGNNIPICMNTYSIFYDEIYDIEGAKEEKKSIGKYATTDNILRIISKSKRDTHGTHTTELSEKYKMWNNCVTFNRYRETIKKFRELDIYDYRLFNIKKYRLYNRLNKNGIDKPYRKRK